MSYDDEVLKYIDSHKSEIIVLMQSLIQTESVTGNESRIGALMAEECRKDGLDVELVEPAKNRTNVVARYKGTTGNPKVVMYSHYDTVALGDPTTWTHPALSGEIADGQIWGRGANDDKVGTCCLTMAFRAIRELGIKLKGDILFTHVADEEKGGKFGFKYLMDNGFGEGYDYFFSAHGGSGQTVGIAANGCRRYNIIVYGRAAHTARVEDGVNAVVKAAELIRRLQVLAYEVNKREYPLPDTDTIMKSRFSINKCVGYVSPNTVPDRCELIIDRRFTPLETWEQTEKEIKKVFDQCKADDPEFCGEVSMDSNDWYELSVAPTDSSIVKSIQDAAEKIVGFKPKPAGGSHSSDHGFWSSKYHKPFAGYGISGSISHASNERTKVEDVIKTTKVYALLMLDLLGTN
ncbi:MAG: putative succinyl-diaminopimelate desuccinylase [Thermoproteota archaeon]|nr:putative succinyl-diaminopimelate desuccinylase [Thermoproteota archaeon]